MTCEKPIFLVGAPRSGTSLLRDLLRSHPRLSFPPESHFLPAAYRLWGEVRSHRDADLLLQHLRRHPNLDGWKLPTLTVQQPKIPTFANTVACLFESYALRENKPRWGDKTPTYVEHIPLLNHLYPNSQFIHIIRDGRDVALSFARHEWGPPNLADAGAAWRHYSLAGRRQGTHLGPERYLEVRYEDLLLELEPTMRRLLAWLGEDFSDQVLRRQPPHVPKPSPGSLRDPEVVAGNREKWRSLPPTELAQLQGVIGDALEFFGYPLLGPSSPVPWSVRKRNALHWRAVRALRSTRLAVWRGRYWMWKYERACRQRPLF